MVIRNFEHLVELVKNIDVVKRVAVVCAHDEHTLEALQKAEKDGLAKSVLIGKSADEKEMLKKLSFEKYDSDIIAVNGDSDSSYKAVEIIREGMAEFIDINDGGMMMYSDLENKKQIVENALGNILGKPLIYSAAIV